MNWSRKRAGPEEAVPSANPDPVGDGVGFAQFLQLEWGLRPADGFHPVRAEQAQ
ncbi:MAG: hypothetical protein HS113_09305 [Verrucomicrobiales bacterium]|nr:hypothetical protein [Verrucomicrobiales bacterium]